MREGGGGDKTVSTILHESDNVDKCGWLLIVPGNDRYFSMVRCRYFA